MNMRMYRSLPAVMLAGLLSGIAAAGPSPRIIGGSNTLDGEFPFMAALVQTFGSDYQAQFCGSTVIASRWILTAAHCVENLQASDFQVITGVATLADTPPFAARSNVDAIVRHPQYDTDTLANDIALLHLAAPVATSPGFLVDDGSGISSLAEGADVTVIGWGVIDQGNVADPDDDLFSATLQKAVLDYLPWSHCNSGEYFSGQLDASMFCAVYGSGTPRDTCYGDSGGPVLLDVGGGQWRQLGLTSFGSGDNCALLSEPGAYLNLGRYNGFIAGAQTAPDLAVTVREVSRADPTSHVRIRVTTTNLSPLNDAAGVTLTISLHGRIEISENAGLIACTTDYGSTTPPDNTTITCPLGNLRAGIGASRELVINLPQNGTQILEAVASSTSGDYFLPNNNDGINFAVATMPADDEPSAALSLVSLLGSSSLSLILLLLPLALRQRHAPHHSLRLRQLLRIG